jgi:branched-chain amino acid transport system ATP-binding protein
VARLREDGITILLVEQNVEHVLKIADRGYVLENGRIVLEDTGANLLQDPRLKTAYLGL